MEVSKCMYIIKYNKLIKFCETIMIFVDSKKRKINHG